MGSRSRVEDRYGVRAKFEKISADPTRHPRSIHPARFWEVIQSGQYEQGTFLVRCMSPKLAHSGPSGMSAFRSLSGADRTLSKRHPTEAPRRRDARRATIKLRHYPFEVRTSREHRPGLFRDFWCCSGAFGADLFRFRDQQVAERRAENAYFIGFFGRSAEI
jgi:hypothetical protein